jgi:hypothetical protein
MLDLVIRQQSAPDRLDAGGQKTEAGTRDCRQGDPRDPGPAPVTAERMNQTRSQGGRKRPQGGATPAGVIEIDHPLDDVGHDLSRGARLGCRRCLPNRGQIGLGEEPSDAHDAVSKRRFGAQNSTCGGSSAPGLASK